MATDTPDTLRINAFHKTNGAGALLDSHRETPQHVEISSTRFGTKEEAEAFAANFPKSTRLVVRMCTHYEGGRVTRTTWGFDATVKLLANGVNGGRNEAGIKRIRTLLKNAEAKGVNVEWGMGYGNSMAEADFRRLVLD